MNIFRILSSYDGLINEPNVSAFLAYLLDPYGDHGIAGLLLQKILGEFLIKDKTFLSGITYNNRITDLSSFSRFNINIIPEFSVYLYQDSTKRKRDIDILIEISDEKNNILYSICVENKITDSSIIKNDSQLEDELQGLKNYYSVSEQAPEIYLAYLTPYPSEKSSESFNKLSYERKIHIFWDNEDNKESIFSKLNEIFNEEHSGFIDPINNQSMYLIKSFQSFIKTGFKSYIEEKNERKEKTSYGKPVLDYLNEYSETLDHEKEYSVDEVREGLAGYVKKSAGADLHKATRNAHVLLSIVNDRNRGHYNVKDPSDSRKNLFYYPDPEKNKKIIKRFNQKINSDVSVYFKNSESNEIEYKSASEL